MNLVIVIASMLLLQSCIYEVLVLDSITTTPQNSAKFSIRPVGSSPEYTTSQEDFHNFTLKYDVEAKTFAATYYNTYGSSQSHKLENTILEFSKKYGEDEYQWQELVYLNDNSQSLCRFCLMTSGYFSSKYYDVNKGDKFSWKMTNLNSQAWKTRELKLEYPQLSWNISEGDIIDLTQNEFILLETKDRLTAVQKVLITFELELPEGNLKTLIFVRMHSWNDSKAYIFASYLKEHFNNLYARSNDSGQELKGSYNLKLSLELYQNLSRFWQSQNSGILGNSEKNIIYHTKNITIKF